MSGSSNLDSFRDKLSIAVNDLCMHILTYVLVEEMLQLRYVKFQRLVNYGKDGTNWLMEVRPDR